MYFPSTLWVIDEPSFSALIKRGCLDELVPDLRAVLSWVQPHGLQDERGSGAGGNASPWGPFTPLPWSEYGSSPSLFYLAPEVNRQSFLLQKCSPPEAQEVGWRPRGGGSEERTQQGTRKRVS